MSDLIMDKKSNFLENITWSVMGKQTAQAEKFYWSVINHTKRQIKIPDI